MAYDNYGINQDGTYTFQGAGVQPLTVPGYLGQQHVAAIGMPPAPPAPVVPPPGPDGISPELTAAAAPGPDMRTADASDVMPGKHEPSLLRGLGVIAGDIRNHFAGEAKDFSGAIKGEKKPAASVAAETPTGAPPVAPGAVIMKHQDQGIPTYVLGGAGGGHVTPGHMQTTAVQTQRTVLPQGATQAIDQANDAQGQAIEHATDAEIAQNKQIGQIKSGVNLDAQFADDDAKLAEQSRKRDMAEQNQRLQAYSSALGSGEIDPNHMWKNTSDRDKSTAAIGVALGAFAAGMNGGQNHALNIITQAIDRDVDAQKATFANKKGKVEAQRGVMGDMMQIYGDERKAEAAAKVTMFEQAARQIDLTVTENSPAVLKARAEAAKAELAAKAADYRAKLESYQVSTHDAYVPPSGGASAPVMIHADIKKDEVVPGPDGKEYEFPESSKDAREKLQTINSQLRDTNIVREVLADPLHVADPAKRKIATGAMARIKQRNAKAEGTGNKVNESVLQLADDALGGNPNALLNWHQSDALEQYEYALRDDAKGIIDGNAISTVESHQEVNPKTGEAVIRYKRLTGRPARAPNMTQVGER